MSPDKKPPMPQGLPKYSHRLADKIAMKSTKQTDTQNIEGRVRPLDLDERLKAIDRTSNHYSNQAKRYENITGTAKIIATEEIIRYIKSCDNLGTKVDPVGIREIIDDAIKGRRTREYGF